MIIDEPVRGSIPPPWFPALPGIERIRAFSNGLLPLPPLFRLLGIRPAHVGPGAGTWTMPASEWFHAGAGLEISAFVETVLTGVATTAVPPGVEVVPVTFSMSYFRPARAQHGNFLARGRVVNAGSLFTFAEVEIEDPHGRQVAHGTSQLAIRTIEPPPTPPPSELRPVEEPIYPTPDPCRRPAPSAVLLRETWGQNDGLSVVRMLTDHRTWPYRELHGNQVVELDEGRIVGTIPASEWFCRFSRDVAPGMVASIATVHAWLAGFSLMRPGDWPVGLDHYMRFHQPVPANDQLLRAEAHARRVRRDGGDLGEITVTIYDADGSVAASAYSTAVYADSSKRQRRVRPEAKRILTTLLFTDIVGSTEHAERLGDARWRALLEEHRTLVRTEIARCEGIEVDTAGDGFFVRFESPARALQCARTARDAVKRLGIEIRAGIHTGECELQGRNLTGMAVHIAARVQAAATPGEILVSETVKAIAIGSGIRFEDRGQHLLKGVPGEWRLYSAVG